jgi:hypothetical protein
MIIALFMRTITTVLIHEAFHTGSIVRLPQGRIVPFDALIFGGIANRRSIALVKPDLSSRYAQGETPLLSPIWLPAKRNDVAPSVEKECLQPLSHKSTDPTSPSNRY